MKLVTFLCSKTISGLVIFTCYDHVYKYFSIIDLPKDPMSFSSLSFSIFQPRHYGDPTTM